MKNRNARIKWLSAGCTLLLIVVLLLTNALLARANMRVDLTEEGLYTLSDGSRAIMESLEDPARIKVFWHNVPLRFDNTKRYIAGLLDEMDDASSGKVQSQWVDMSEEAGLAQASELGLEEHRFAVRHGAEFRQAMGYMSLVIEIGDATPEKINELANITDKLEYRIVSSIFKGQRAAPPIIALVQKRPFNARGGPQAGRFAYLERELSLAFGDALRSYITLDKDIPEDVDVMILADPRDLSEEQVYRFEQFLLRGGRAVVLCDPLDARGVAGPNVQVVRSAPSGLEDWLTHVGVTVEKGCVVDFHEKGSCLYPQEQRDRFGRVIGVDWVRYAHWPKVQPENCDQTNPVMRYLQPMATYWPAALSINEERQKTAGRKVAILASSSAEGYRRGDVTNLRRAGITREGKLLERVPLIALVEGPLTSFWAGRPKPGEKPAEPVPPEPDQPTKDDDPKGDDPKGDAPQKDDSAKAPGGSPDGDPDGQPEAGTDAPKKDAPKKDAPKEAPPPADAPKKAPPPAKAPPQDEPKKSDGDDEADATEPTGPERLQNGNVRFVIMGDADLVANSFNPRIFLTSVNGAYGFPFVQNMAEWLSGSEDLMALRSRATNPRNLAQMDEGKRDMIKHVNLLLVPLLVLLAGMTVFIVRRSA